VFSLTTILPEDIYKDKACVGDHLGTQIFRNCMAELDDYCPKVQLCDGFPQEQFLIEEASRLGVAGINMYALVFQQQEVAA
jgi:hypothetical protein